MKKIIIATLLATVATASFATKTNTVLAAGVTTVATGSCLGAGGTSMLSAAVKINLSTSNIGNVSCDDATASLGVGVGNTAGKGHVYSASSAGGSIVDTATTNGAAPTATNVLNAADTSSASS